MVAAEIVTARKLGRIRLEPTPDEPLALVRFAERTVEHIKTDGARELRRLSKLGYRHDHTQLRSRVDVSVGPDHGFSGMLRAPGRVDPGGDHTRMSVKSKNRPGGHPLGLLYRITCMSYYSTAAHCGFAKVHAPPIPAAIGRCRWPIAFTVRGEVLMASDGARDFIGVRTEDGVYACGLMGGP